MQPVGRKISEAHVIPQKAGSMLGFQQVLSDGTDMYYWSLDLPRLFVQLLGAGLLTAAGYVITSSWLEKYILEWAGVRVEAAEPIQEKGD